VPVQAGGIRRKEHFIFRVRKVRESCIWFQEILQREERKGGSGMEKSTLDEKIAEISKTILSYCMARTSSQYDAEDLAQDMLLEIYRSSANIRDERAFYGFLWSVAGNVYRQWCRRKRRAEECELPEELPDFSADPAADLETDSDIWLLRRELALLAEKYRQAAVLYYLEDRSCAQIARTISVSESMVKYLLFKSRQIVKEGMNMERKLGEQSYNPRRLRLGFWGGVNRYGGLCDSLISQNILYACYNDRLTAEQISLEIGVALPYMEGNLEELLEYGLLHKAGNYYSTDIVIFTKEFEREADRKTEASGREIADKVRAVLEEKEAAVRAVGFYGADMDENTYRWQMACILLDQAVLENIEPEYPVNKFGEKCFVWGYESYERNEEADGFGLNNCTVQNDRGDRILFKDFAVNGEMLHKLFFRRRDFANVLLDTADGRTDGFGGTDRAILADLVERGIVKKDGEMWRLNMPVFTDGQQAELNGILKDAAEEVTAMTRKMMEQTAEILRNHMPSRLKKTAGNMAYLRMFGDSISKPVELLYREKFLRPIKPGDMLPTTFVVLNRQAAPSQHS